MIIGSPQLYPRLNLPFTEEVAGWIHLKIIRFSFFEEWRESHSGSCQSSDITPCWAAGLIYVQVVFLAPIAEFISTSTEFVHMVSAAAHPLQLDRLVAAIWAAVAIAQRITGQNMRLRLLHHDLQPPHAKRRSLFRGHPKPLSEGSKHGNPANMNLFYTARISRDNPQA